MSAYVHLHPLTPLLPSVDYADAFAQNTPPVTRRRAKDDRSTVSDNDLLLFRFDHN